MNKKITLDNGKEYVVLEQINYDGKVYCLTDRVISNQLQKDFNVFEKIMESDGTYSLSLIESEELKSEILKNSNNF